MFTVSFNSDVTYAQALRLLTDLGLQPGYECSGGFSQSPNSTEWPLWNPMGQHAQFAQSHTLLIEPRALVDASWFLYLRAQANVTHVAGALPQTCPAIDIPLFAQPPAGPPAVFLTSEQSGVVRLVTFAAGVSYDDALYLISDLGLRLSDPCLEAAIGDDQAPAWRSAGQETTFAATHSLLVETTLVTSSLWPSQLARAPGVLSVAAPPSQTC